MTLRPHRPPKDLTPAVSVIIPVYNRFGMLRQAVASVLCQTWRDFELIVVDDGSSDDTGKIETDGLEPDMSPLCAGVKTAAAYWPADNAVANGAEGSATGGRPVKRGAADHPAAAAAAAIALHPEHPLSFSYQRLKHTGMPGAVRNRGVRAARGKYVAFLDSDDLWLPRKLEQQFEFMRKSPALRISHTRELWLRAGKTVSQASQRHKRSGRLFGDSLVKCIIGPSTVMMERSLFIESGGFREDLEIAEDYELWLRITSTHRIGYVDSPLTVKRGGHTDQLSSKYGQIEIFRIEALSSLLDAGCFKGGDREHAAAQLSRKCLIYANGARKRGKIEEALKYESLGRAHTDL